MENNGSDMVETPVRLAFGKVGKATPFTYCKDCDNCGGAKCSACRVDDVLSTMREAEPIDLVLCKDCRYYAPLITGEKICFCDLRGMTTYDDDFCSRGKRRKKKDATD